jgi:hypothetical protein
MVKPNCFKLSLREKTVYFIVNNIKKTYVYTANGKDFYDYQVVIKDVHHSNNSEPFEEKYSGSFLCINENKKISIYDNINKKYIDIEKNENLHHLSYYYGINHYWTSLENVIKEIFLSIFLSENC